MSQTTLTDGPQTRAETSENLPVEHNHPVLDRSGFGRRRFIAAGAALLAATPTPTPAGAADVVKAPKAPVLPRRPGAPMTKYGQPSSHEADVVRSRIRSQAGTTGSGASGTPLQHLQGTITPSGLHFERHHAGVPLLDPTRHKLVIHGAVQRALEFDLEKLHRYPMTTRTQFLECSGNSAALLSPKPLDWNCADIHGLVSCSEWTGVPLSLLLDEVGIDKAARWVVAEGADAGRMNRSVPLHKCLDDAIIALYQNGERLRPENGYPMRLFLPGFEGNLSIKWLHRLEVARSPAMSREETSKYTDLRPGGLAEGFTFNMDVKSVITSPSPGLNLNQPGPYQISGLAWTGTGNIARVEVSVDGGRSWMDAPLQEPPRALALNRFTAAWQWHGNPGVLMSRAYDTKGNVQPTRNQWIKKFGINSFYHYNAIQAWRVTGEGRVENTYAA